VIPLVLTKLSMTMEEATIAAWLVDDGAEVTEGEPVVEVETDKAQNELEAPASGVLRIVAGVGEQVLVDGVIAEIHAGGAADAAPEPTRPAAPERAPLSPAARRAAQRLGVDLAAVTGTGPRGRIVVEDIERAAATAASPATPVLPASAAAPAGGLREAVVANISASWRTIPHIHISGELVADGLSEARQLATGRAVRLTVTDLLLLALTQALAEVPELNGTVDAAGPRHSAAIDLSIAVATPAGVVAPTLRGAHELSLDAIARERARLVEEARSGRLAPRDLAGGTCTLSNLGAFPVDFFAPVVSGPQIAMLAVGRIAEKPIASGGLIGIGRRITANVAIDHRGADGEAGGRLLAALERRIAALPAHV
jgi:pyruvate dehydrogenase E2 component (dihydrolipoamide acetyltransferase)